MGESHAVAYTRQRNQILVFQRTEKGPAALIGGGYTVLYARKSKLVWVRKLHFFSVFVCLVSAKDKELAT
jgi:GR25 family glycosyltransferase involved in LPS biosynthesis